MTEVDSAGLRVIGVEEHAWTAELRDALLRYGGDDTVNLITRGDFGGDGGATAFVESALLGSVDQAKLAHANAERLFRLTPVG